MADYAKKTVAELQEILKSRGLPSSGKKAELVSRLNENDKEAAVAAEETPTVPEPQPVSVAEAEPISSTTTIQSATETLQPPTDPTSTAVDNPSPDTTLANQTTYALNLPTSSLDSELAKRKARAERFGTGAPAPDSAANGDASTGADSIQQEPVAETDAEALRNLERAKRFGTGQTAIGKLDEALPSEMARGRKRGHGAVAEGAELDDPGLKRSFTNRGRGGRGGRFRSRGGRGGGLGGAPAAKPQGVQKGAPAYTSEKDKLAAEARKKKFATA